MAKLTLLPSAKNTASTMPAAHRAAVNEGEAAKRLLEANGYPIKRKANGQYESRCPFHQLRGELENKASTKFYLDAEKSTYYCHSASCGERGNLQTLERHFGVDSDAPEFKTREDQLVEWETALRLSPELKQVFYDHGLTDPTIERFRLGWDQEKQRYVIPYLEGRRPRAFRFYDPSGNDPKGRKYWWEQGSTAQLFNASDAVGDQDGRVFVCEGEQKAMLLCQLGYAAVAVPGAGTFKTEWHTHFANARKIIVVFDNDDSATHVYDRCARCGADDQCRGHNPGQEGAVKVVDALGWRASNVVLPRPEGERKTDVNEFFVRDGNTATDFAELALGEKKSPYRVLTLAEIFESPPEESAFLISNGILPQGGRLLVSGAPKVGKSIFIQNMALSVAAGIPFLSRFHVDHPTRVLLLDRELSKRSLFERFEELIGYRPGYRAALDNLCIDHDVQLRLDRKGAVEVLTQLVEENGAEVVIFDTAYKFFSGNFQDSSISKAFEVLDTVIAQTGVSVVMTHHHRKKDKAQKGETLGDPDDVVGSFLWTGWPNGTVLLNFLERRIESPFNTVASFTAFRDAAPPEPVALYRDRDGIAYTAIADYNPPAESDGRSSQVVQHKPSTEALGELLLEMVPVVEDDFMHLASARFGVRAQTLRPFLIDLLSQGHFVRSSNRPPILDYAYSREEESYEEAAGFDQLELVGGQQ